MSFVALYNGQTGSNSYQIGAATSDDGKDWTRYLGNPVLGPTGAGWESDHVKDPCLVHDGSLYVAFYAGHDGTQYAGIGRATAPVVDGAWTRYGSNPVIVPGSAGQFDDDGVIFPTVLHEPDDVAAPWKMWYGGVKASDGKTRIGYASSLDGLAWTKHGQVVDVGASASWSDEGILPGAIYLDGATYHLFVGGRQGTTTPRWQGGVYTFADPLGAYTAAGGNPTLLARFNTANTTGVLTANTTIGSDQVRVGTTAAYNVGEEVYLIDGNSESESHRIESIDSGTAITLEAVAVALFDTVNGATFRSAAYNSVFLRSAIDSPEGGYWGFGTDFQVLDGLSPGGSALRESSLRWEAATLTGAWSYDYDHGHLFPVYPGVSLGAWDSISAENPSVRAFPEPSEPGEDPDDGDPPTLPAGALLEIYVAEAGAYRWDEAEWDEATWSSSAWTDVTPQGVSATVRDGVDRADQGILARVVASDWTVHTYDPDRKIDPANADSPFAPEIVAGLPIRLSHRGAVVAQGACLRIQFAHAQSYGQIRATDSLFPLRAATVPSTAILPDTLYARTRAVLAAIGREDIIVARDPSGGDIDVAPWDLGDNDSAWLIIEESAREALWFPMVGPTGAIFFRAWADPLDRGAVIGSTHMEDLTVVSSDDGVVSVVRVNDDVSSTTIERRITPLPRYGERVHERTRLTIDGEAYADAILFDRGAASTRWVPGDVHAFTGADVERFARIVSGEIASIDYPEADPPVEVVARVLGRTIHVVGGRFGPTEAFETSRWRFRYHASVEALEPLSEDGVLGTQWLTSDDDDGYLYPDGVIGLT